LKQIKELHIWDIEKGELIQRYFGHKQEKFLIRCCFGGNDDAFIASGSEGRLYSCIENIFERWKKLHLASKFRATASAIN